MAAGDLENIRPVDTSGNVASLTRNINFVDNVGVIHPVSEVYWSDAQGQTHLVWKRDHEPGPVGDTYTNLNNNQWIMFEWTCPEGVTAITSCEIWYATEPPNWNKYFNVYNSSRECIHHQENSGNVSTETLNVDGTDKTVYKFSITLSSSFTVVPGTKYYIGFWGGLYGGTPTKNIAYTNKTGTYWLFTGTDEHLGNHNTLAANEIQVVGGGNKIKATINGAEI